MARHFDDVLLGSIELFCMSAELGSFTAAATAAGVTPAAVSRSIARLEQRLNLRLFVRSTRQIRLTEAGRTYFEECREALNRLLEAERTASGEQARPSGRLRISLPTTYGHYRVLPVMPRFQESYPDVQVELHISNRNVDFFEEGFDLAIRARPPADSAMIARKLEDAELVIVGAPDYLKRTGQPSTLEELRNHACIQFFLPSSGRPVPWIFRRKNKDVEILTAGALCCAEDLLGGVTLARSGAGLFQAHRFTVEEDLREGRLVEVLQQFGGRSRPFTLLYPHSRMMPARVRVFVDFLVETLGSS
ncbi:MAG: LysR family transcriptional regulator [Burkholderiales bacterium RIFCSPLOWO2_02_FULL_57_36]|nr:MAG: LysR family transcriptional regulator [Burkholderiales bacterium RIFCSPLOWO2_02_FULL_57_36]